VTCSGFLWLKNGMAILSLIWGASWAMCTSPSIPLRTTQTTRERASPDQAGFMAFDLAAEILGGQRSGIRIEPATLMFYDPTARSCCAPGPNRLYRHKAAGHAGQLGKLFALCPGWRGIAGIGAHDAWHGGRIGGIGESSVADVRHSSAM
jgi:hypothetical protein